MTDRPVAASIRRLNLIGFATVAGLVIVGVGWATTTRVSAAVIAAGQLVVETDIKSVQHPAGGIIGEIRVRDGDLVAAGQVLMRLDGTNAAAELAIVVGRLYELLALQGLLVAERDDAGAIAFAPELRDRVADPAVAAILAATESELALRRRTREGEIAQLAQQRLRLAEDATGLREQSLAKARELELVRTQLDTFRGLVDRQLMERSQLTALERDEVRLGGEMAQIAAGLASNERHAEELAIQIQRVGQDYRSAAALELRETNAMIAELQERRIAAQAQLDRLEILAPQAGIVHELAVHTIGGVVAPGEDLMRIVPLADQLIVETRVSPLDRDQLIVGQAASLQLAAFDRQALGRFDGRIIGISPTTSVDDRTGAPYYSVRIVMAGNLASPPSELIPGMLVTAYITTEPRTVASFLLAPLLDQIGRTFREGVAGRKAGMVSDMLTGRPKAPPMHLTRAKRFRRAIGAILLGVTGALPGPAEAQDLRTVLANVYATSPTIAAARSAVRVAEEGVVQARSQLFPTIAGTATIAGRDDILGPAIPAAIGVEVEQLLYAGGTARNGIAAAEIAVAVANESLRNEIQESLFEGVAAYVDLWHAQAVLALAAGEVNLVGSRLNDLSARLAAGEATRTAVAQMEAEWHMMLADRALATAGVQIAAAEYRRITGLEARPLDRPATGFQLPSTAEAMEIAMNAHPAVLATRRQAEIAALGIDIAIGGMRPTVTLFGEVGIGTDLAGAGNWEPAATIGGRITIPIFGGGQRLSATREAREIELQARLATDRIVAEVLALTVAAYAQLEASVARLRAAEDLEDALADVLSAVEEEVAAGGGALAAVNEAQRDLFDARVGVLDAVRDRTLAVFNVLRMIGRLSPAALGIAG